MQEPARERLDSWKGIAAYLGRDLRTVRRWEKDKGLPVHRVPGGERQAVFAYRAEIDAWLVRTDASLPGPQLVLAASATQGREESAVPVVAIREPAAIPATSARSGWWWKPIFTLRRITLAAILLTVLVVFAFGLALISGRPAGAHLDRVALSGNSLQGWNAGGKLLWTYSFARPLSEADQKNPARIKIAEKSRLSQREILVMAPLNIPSEATPASDALFAFSESGDLLWRHDFAQTFRFGSTSYGPPWVASPAGGLLASIDASDSSIWSVANSFFGSPSDLMKLDSKGHLLAEFVNWGHIHVLNHFRSGAGSFILAGGINNDCNCAMLAVLREDEPSGRSPSLLSEASRCVNCPAGQPYRYLLFPRSEVAAATDFTYNQVRGIVPDEGGIRLIVKETKNGDEELGADWDMYELSADFVPQSFSVSDHLVVLHRQLEAQGKLKHTVQQCPELHQPRLVKIWSPEQGWQSVAVPPVQVELSQDLKKQSAKNVHPMPNR